ncbi:MAG: hypothetical protein AAGA54_36315 [Myxococcota bacterium]
MSEFDDFLADAKAGADRLSATPDFEAVLAEVEGASADVEPSMDAWLSAAQAAVERVVEQARPPSFEDALRRMDPAPDEAAANRSRTSLLEGAVADTRAVVERTIEARAELGGATVPHRWTRTIVVGVLALAAAVVGALSLGGGSSLRPQAEQLSPQQAGFTAIDEAARAVAERRTAPEPQTTPTLSQSAPHVETEPEVEPVADVEPEAAPVSTSSPRRSKKPDLGALAEAADRQWKAGDLVGARKLLETIVRRGGRSSRVEMAYADLFVMAKQSGRKAERSALFSAYLRKFPRGRFAEDARAGRCRLTGSNERAACWTRYLAAHPKGVYAAEAREGADVP